MSIFGNRQNEIFDAENDITVFDRVISLGGDGHAAHQLERLGLRYEAYPFDRLISADADKAIDALENDFEEWFDLVNLTEDGSDEAYRRVTDKKYNTVYRNIFPIDRSVEDSYKELKPISDRRVKRLVELKDQELDILFIRTNLNKEQTARLGKIIGKKFGKNAFLLVVNYIHDFEIHKIDTNVKNTFVYEIYDETENTDATQPRQGYDPHWDRLMRNIRVREEDADIADDSLFENFYPCENGNGREKFRWSQRKSVIHLDKFGGCKCSLRFSSPVPVKFKLANAAGRVLIETMETEKLDYTVNVRHDTRFISVTMQKTWRPCDKLWSNDMRELGVRVDGIHVQRKKE